MSLLLAALWATFHVAASSNGLDGALATQHRPSQAVLPDQASTVKIKIRIEDEVVPATLNGSRAAQDFASLLPLSLTLEDYASTEKISGLPKRLSTDGAPRGSDPSVGDLAYYAPWGNLAVYYRDFGYSSGLVLLGSVDSGIEALARPGPLEVKIELAEPQDVAR
jgi:hypothetical protein